MSITGIGVPGSLAHVVTNKNMSAENKGKCLREQYALGSKLCGATAASTAIAVATLTKDSSGFEDCLKAVRDKLQGVSIGNKNLLASIENSKIGKAFLNLPTKGKAAVIVGTGALAVFGTLAAHIANMKSAYIEGKYEQK